jgi:hypothetical protein
VRAQTASVSRQPSDSDATRRGRGGRRTVRTRRAYRLPWPGASGAAKAVGVRAGVRGKP